MATAVHVRPASDIEEDIREFIRTYDPLKQSRAHFSFEARDGHVILKGHVKSAQARRVLVDNVPDIKGVVSMDASQLYDDETLRLEIGKVVPPGVLARVNYGSVVLQPLIEVDKEQVIEAVKRVPGVLPDKITWHEA